MTQLIQGTDESQIDKNMKRKSFADKENEGFLGADCIFNFPAGDSLTQLFKDIFWQIYDNFQEVLISRKEFWCSLLQSK